MSMNYATLILLRMRLKKKIRLNFWFCIDDNVRCGTLALLLGDLEHFLGDR